MNLTWKCHSDDACFRTGLLKTATGNMAVVALEFMLFQIQIAARPGDQRLCHMLRIIAVAQKVIALSSEMKLFGCLAA